jgi:hypothetical protein
VLRSVEIIQAGKPSRHVMCARFVAVGAFCPHIIANFTITAVEDHCCDDVTGIALVQLLPERFGNFREAGRVLIGQFGGDFRNVLRRAGGYLYRDDGQGFMQLLIKEFPRSFGGWPLTLTTEY